MRQLLIVGRDLNQLMSLSIALRGYSHVLTIAVTDDTAARAVWSASKGPCQIIVCLDARDATIDVRSLVGIPPTVLFLTPESQPDLAKRLKEGACLVLAAGERSSVISATLIAYGSGAVRA